MRKLLIVDDIKINREILKKILGDDYEIVEAEDGKEALDILSDEKTFSAILLDIAMPVMDGFEFLERIRGDKVLSQIPVIVTTGQTDVAFEIKALELGANDYITKPYNSVIIRQRIKNTVKLRETAAMVNELRKDLLTGLDTRESFFKKVDKLIAAAEPGTHVMLCLNIDGFKVINDQYGPEKGDELLKYVAGGIKIYAKEVKGICCRVMADSFAMLAPLNSVDMEGLQKYVLLTQDPPCLNRPIKVRIGYFIINDVNLKANAIYDRATIAEQSVKGKYDKFVASFEESMRDRLLSEQEMVTEMDAALKNREFKVWFQPQYNHSTGSLIGAEALVRWLHPIKGLVSPKKFIPVFEQNGFIYELDRYVWEEACRYLRKWKDAGLKPLPVSVNISRVDFFSADIVEVICNLLEKYDVSPSHLRLEITESAFADETNRVVSVVRTLVEKGFIIEIDDFGSGYSSLNTLKSVPAQVVKLDMRFLESNDNARRGENIIESVVRMTKWLGMTIIAEGVERKEQADFLKSIGCNYVQGYLYARPMDAESYEAFFHRIEREEKLFELETVENMDNNSFWDPRSMDTLIFNSYVGGACIFEYKDGEAELLRVNDKYLGEFCKEGTSAEKLYAGKMKDSMDEENWNLLKSRIERAIETGKEKTCELCISKLYGKNRCEYVRTTVRKIARAGDRFLLYASVANVTARVLAEQRVADTAKQLKAVMDNVSCGITAVYVVEGKVRYVLTNDKYYELLGYTKEEYAEEIRDEAYTTVFFEDVENVAAAIERATKSGKTENIEYRALRRDKKVIWIKSYISVVHLDGIPYPVQLSIYTDITAAKRDEEELKIIDGNLSFLNETAHDLLAQNDIDKGINETLDRLLRYFEGDRGYIFEFDYPRNPIYNSYEVCTEKAESKRNLRQNIPARVFAFWSDFFKKEKYVYIGDVNEHAGSEHERLFFERENITSLVAVPLKREGELIGFIGIDNPRSANMRIERLVAIGDYVAVMLTRRDLNAKIINDNIALKTMTNDIPGGYVRMRLFDDNTVKPVYFNDGFCRLVKMTQEELFDLYENDVTAGIPEEDVPIVVDINRRLIKDGEVHSAKYRLKRGDGSYVWVTIFGRKTCDEKGNYFLNIYYVDASEENRLEENRKELLDNFPCGAALYEYDGNRLRVIHLNKRYWELVKRTPPDDFSKIDVEKTVHPDDVSTVEREIVNALRQDQNHDIDFKLRVINGQGGYTPMRFMGKLTKKEGGKYYFYSSCNVEETAVNDSDSLPVAVSAIISSSENMSFVKGKNFGYLCCSPSFAELCGYTEEKDVVGKTDFELFDKVFAESLSEIDKKIFETKKSDNDREMLLPSKDGKVRYGSASRHPLYDARGEFLGIYGVVKDVTSQHNAYQQLKLLSDSILGGLATYVGNAEDGFKLTYYNDGFCRLFNVTREYYDKLSGGDPFIGVFEEDLPILREQLEALVKNNLPMDCVYRVFLKNGSFKWINMRGIASERAGSEIIVNAVLFDVTGLQSALEKLRISEETNRLALQHGDGIIGKFDVEKRSVTLSPASAKMLNIPEELKNLPYSAIESGLISPESVESFVSLYNGIIQGVREGGSVYRQRFENSWKWMEARFSTIFDNGGKPIYAVISYFDVTDKMEKEAAYKKWQQSFSDKNAKDYTLFRCNISRRSSFDMKEGELLNIKFAPGDFNFDDRTSEYAERCVVDEDREKFINFLKSDTLLANYYRNKRSDILEFKEVLPVGGYRWLKLTVDMVEYPNSEEIEGYLLFENIDEEKRAALLTIERAETDPLTGLFNRLAFKNRVEKKMKESEKGAQHAFLMIDIDGFKLVNDAFGHATGDRALIEIANSLRGSIRSTDYVCRLGGDEFLVFLCNVPSNSSVILKAQHLCSIIRKSYSMEVQISGSIGISMSPSDGTSFRSLYEKADAALYHVKGSGKDNYSFYSEGMENERFEPDMEIKKNLGLKSEKKRRMLIVDDNSIDYNMLANMFKNEFIIEKAQDGASALIRLRHYGTAVSVVLLDLIMPGMDGFAVLEKMQENPELRTVPVVVVSGDENRETSLKAIRFGASDFVIKPVDPDLLRIRVYSAISKAENDRLRAKNSLLELQSNATECYKAVLDRRGICLIEHDWVKGSFKYSPSIENTLAGKYNGRKLWQILLSDMVADTDTVKKLQNSEHKLAFDKKNSECSLRLKLKTASGEYKEFLTTIYKLSNEFGVADKFIFTFEGIDGVLDGVGG